MSLASDTWSAFTDNEGWERLTQHVQLSVVALLAAVAIGTALGIACAKGGPVGSFVIAASGLIGRTVPTFAAMALVIAFTSIGFWPAAIGLTALGIPSVLLNLATGIRGADVDAVEAARGMGLTSGQILRQVELPLAVPLAFTGVRNAAVMIVATAALAGAVGAGGLGVTIIAGLSNNQTDVLLAGAIPVTLLAVAAEGLVIVAQMLVTPKRLRRVRRQARLLGRNQ
jgi:osmoprotectant transport system permease protein